MTDYSDKPRMLDPFERAIAEETSPERREELRFMKDYFKAAQELIGDIDCINATLIHSERPDLVLIERTTIMEAPDPEECTTERLGNFIPHLTAFGPLLFKKTKNPWTGEMEQTTIGRRQPTDEELGQYFLMGARGKYPDHLAFAIANGIDQETASDMFMTTHLRREAFMRMWILFPELTQFIMTNCLNEPGRDRHLPDRKMEVWVAYNLMSRLVNIDDKGVKKGGKIDNWMLCH